MRDVIQRLLSSGAVNMVSSQPDQFIFNYFAVNNSNGDHQFVLNLKELNKFLQADHFKVKDLRAATRLISMVAMKKFHSNH